MQGHVITAKERSASRGTHELYIPEGGGAESSQDSESERVSEPGVLTSCRGKWRDSQVSKRKLERGYSLSVKCRRRNESG
jgi:hypothetical protein